MKEYGLLYYDIPASQVNLYHKIKRTVNKTCLPVNLSVYVFDWGLKNTLDKKFKEIGAYNKASINLIKFDNTSKAQLEELASKQLEKIFEDMQERVRATISKLNDTEKKKDYLERTARKVKNYSRLLTIYEFTKKVEPALDVLKKVISEEWNFCIGKSITK